ncbi:MAG TPA: hypothetical protein PK014_05070 [Thermoanaerobaculia bacterium]|nr:hypothetical protein [Thermoanaerobaculia bacterium]HUM29478.1 hypothetical protein [Thermoanaerobaculia bacterium]HXK67861.1 hypothetical protein [Thermoanaerobaculia bacterium]
MKRVGIVLAVIVLLGLTSCAKVPQETIDGARAALDSARKAEASLYAPDALKAAEAKVAELDTELDTQKAKWFKSYARVSELAAEVTATAQKAEDEALAGKVRAKTEAEAALAGADTALTETRNALASAPRGKGTSADLAALSGDLDAASATLDEARSAMETEKYLDAKAKVDSAMETISRVTTDIENARAMMAAARKK